MLWFFHGLESGPTGAKYHALTQAFGHVESPDFREMDLEARVAHAEALTRGLSGQVVVGSSFGGLVASLLYQRHPERFSALVLLAPALHREWAAEVKAFPENTVVIHGLQDDVVPFDQVQDFCRSRGVEVVAVDDEHRLAYSMDLIVEKIRPFLPSK